MLELAFARYVFTNGVHASKQETVSDFFFCEHMQIKEGL